MSDLTHKQRTALTVALLGLNSKAELDHVLLCANGCGLDDFDNGLYTCRAFDKEFRGWTPTPPSPEGVLVQKLWSEVILDTLRMSYPVLRFPKGYQVQP